MFNEFGCSIGFDPEFFFTKGGKVIGSERVIPPTGLDVLSYNGFGPEARKSGGLIKKAGIVVDGVQAELNPNPHSCRANLGNEIAATFKNLRDHLKTMGDVKVSFAPVVDVDRDELEALSDKSKVFGCAPSYNLYDLEAGIPVDPRVYLKRSAGGHLHMGFGSPIFYEPKINAETGRDRYGMTPDQPGFKTPYDHRKRLVMLLDILLGNTCVMLDRDPNAPERRKVYGRAGEYRLPEHGLEYRTLSNFWLRAYPLMSFVAGMARVAGGVLATTLNANGKNDVEGRLLKMVDVPNIIQAINTNDLALAKQNWAPVREFLMKETVYDGSTFSAYPMDTSVYSGLNYKLMPQFDKFLKGVEENGLESWFPEDPFEHWCNLPEGHGRGWESFLTLTVK